MKQQLIDRWHGARPGRAVRRALAQAAFAVVSLVLAAEIAGAILQLAGLADFRFWGGPV